jgi:hypothetical protein
MRRSRMASLRGDLHREGCFQRPCRIEQMTLMGPTEAQTTLQGRVAKRPEQQPMGMGGLTSSINCSRRACSLMPSSKSAVSLSP